MWIHGAEWDEGEGVEAGRLLGAALPRLSPEIRARYDGAPRKDKVRQSALAEVLLRLALHGRAGLAGRQVRLERPAGGKPRLAGGAPLHFNLTHSGARAYCALADHPVGLDLERLRPAPLAVARRFFTAAERDELEAAPAAERDRVFFALWTLKESLVKLRGTGIAGGLGSFSVTLAGGAPALAAPSDPAGPPVRFAQWDLKGGYLLAACSEAGAFPPAPDLRRAREVLEAFLALPGQ